MIVRVNKIIAGVALFILSGQLLAQSPWPVVTKTAKPWTRWWWMGSAVNEQDISSMLTTYNQAGLGGVEVVPIYGAKGYEQQYIDYLSPQWVRMLNVTIDKASALNMGVNISVGSGWPIGGPQVSLTDAATKLVVQQYTLNATQPFTTKIDIEDSKQKNLEGVGVSAITAYGSNNEVLDISAYLQKDGSLNWKPASGEWKVYVAFNAKTRQQVKRAAPGGVGYTLDHFSANAIHHYLQKFDQALGNTKAKVHAFYNDSYEVFGANWTPNLFAEFEKRRGYSLKPYIKYLTGNDSSEIVARIKSDYRETIADLMLDNFSQPFTDWAHQNKSLSLNQAHGSPGNLLDMYAAVDIPETETFGSTPFDIPGLKRDTADTKHADPDFYMFKYASSAAHTQGNNLVSSETFTWLGEHFKNNWAQCKPEIEQLFLAGVNHMFYHGTTYSPPAASWPGWLFYASLNVVPENSLWPHLQGLNAYITRCQSVLQAGKPDNDILLYWPVYDLWDDAKGLDMPFRAHNLNKWLYPTDFYSDAVWLQKNGYTYDFVSDKMIQEAIVNDNRIRVNPDGNAYKTIIVSESKLMPIATFKSLLQLADNGATIIMQQLPVDVPGLHRLEERRKELNDIKENLTVGVVSKGLNVITQGKGKLVIANTLEKGLRSVQVAGEDIAKASLQYVKRKDAAATYYYIVNHTAKNIDSSFSFNTVATAAQLLNPLTGGFGNTVMSQVNSKPTIRLQLQAGETIIVKFSNTASTNSQWAFYQPAGKSVVLNNKWTLSFTTGGPALPVTRTLTKPGNWTDLGDSTANNFSGTGVYSSTFHLPNNKAADYLLQLGEVNESARVWINDKEVGILWSVPYQAHIGKYVKKGKNTIRIEVANLMANRIRYMDRQGITWRNYHEINFVNIHYKNFDASGWKVMPSGLAGPVRITPLK
jgi:hypothetical protein